MIEPIWFILVGLLGLDLLIASTRTSLFNARLHLLVDMQDQKPQAVNTVELLEEPRLRTSLRFASLTVHLLLAGTLLAILFLYKWLSLPFYGQLVFLFICALIVQATEYLVEGRIFLDLENWAIRLTGSGRLLNLVFKPFAIFLLVFLGKADHPHGKSLVTDEELKSWVEEGQAEGSLEKGERRMIYSIFQLSDTLCREIMVPRIDVTALDVETPVDDAVQAFIDSGHSRLPVYEEKIDNTIGMLYAKDLLKIQLDKNKQLSIRSLLRDAYYVPEAKKVEELLREMQANGVHIAVVVDEYGGMAGLVTLEDIVEEIVGEIRDEYDQAEEPPFEKVSDDEYIFPGRADIEDVNEIMGTHLTREIADTISGYIYGEIGRVPLGGEQLRLEDWILTVDQVDGQRIRQVKAVRQTEETENMENNHERKR
jgi:putative hemolysin